MSWHRTRQWWGALADVSAQIERDRDGRLPWKPGYGEIFGDRAGLLAALRYRWRLTVQAQVEDPDPDASARYGELLAARPGLRLLLGLDDGAPAAPAPPAPQRAGAALAGSGGRR